MYLGDVVETSLGANYVRTKRQLSAENSVSEYVYPGYSDFDFTGPDAESLATAWLLFQRGLGATVELRDHHGKDSLVRLQAAPGRSLKLSGAVLKRIGTGWSGYDGK